MEDGGDASLDGPAVDGGEVQDVSWVVDGRDGVLFVEGAGGGGGATQHWDADGQARQGDGQDGVGQGVLYEEVPK